MLSALRRFGNKALSEVDGMVKFVFSLWCMESTLCPSIAIVSGGINDSELSEK